MVYGQDVERFQAMEQERDSISEQADVKKKIKGSYKSYKTLLDSTLYVPVYKNGRWHALDTAIDTFRYQYPVQERYDLMSTGGFNLHYLDFDLSKPKEEYFGFRTEMVSRGFYSEIPFIQTYFPISRAYFMSDPVNLASSRNTNHFAIFHFQPLGPRSALVINWNRLGTLGLLTRGKQEVTELGVRLYTRDFAGKFWSILDYQYQVEKYAMGGGLTDVSLTSLSETTRGDDMEKKGLAIYFPGRDQNDTDDGLKQQSTRNTLTWKNYYAFLKKDSVRHFDLEDRSYVGTYTNYHNGKWRLYDVSLNPTTYQAAGYTPIYSDKYTQDIRRYDMVENALKLQFRLPLGDTSRAILLGAGAHHQFVDYLTNYFENGESVKIKKIWRDNVWMSGRLKIMLMQNIFFESLPEYGFLGYIQKDLRIYSKVYLAIPKGGAFTLSHAYVDQKPQYEQQYFHSNLVEYNVDLPNEQYQRFRLHYDYTVHSKWVHYQLHLAVQYKKYKNYNYYADAGVPASLPNFNLLQPTIKQNLEVWKFGTDLYAAYYDYNKTDVISLPTWVLKGSLYYKDRLFKKKLEIQIGAEVTYYTQYNLWAFNVSNQTFAPTFQVGENVPFRMAGEYPFLDAFITAKIKKFRLFIKYTNILYRVLPVDYWASHRYLFNESIIKLGIEWRLTY